MPSRLRRKAVGGRSSAAPGGRVAELRARGWARSGHALIEPAPTCTAPIALRLLQRVGEGQSSLQGPVAFLSPQMDAISNGTMREHPI